MSTIELTTTAIDWPAIVDAVDSRGERFRLTRNGKVIAELGPPSCGTVSVKELLNAIARGPRLGSEEATALADDLDEARKAINGHGVTSPWDS